MHEVIVIGAGWSGLVSAKTYLQVKPDATLLIVDGNESLGGTWSSERLYPDLIAEAHHGLFEFSDLPMSEEGIDGDGLIPGSAVNHYLRQYATKYHLVERIRLGARVEKVVREKPGHPWCLKIRGAETLLECEKLIVASGLTSEPFLPNIPRKAFQGEVLHSIQLGHSKVLEQIRAPSVKTVAVYGGSKSAFDAVHTLLKEGKMVHWIIRNGGGGPSMMTPLYILGQPSFRFNNSRLLGLFSPNIWSGFGHGWATGTIAQSLVQGFWKVLTYLSIQEADYDRSANGRLLKPQLGLDTLLWSPATLGVMTHPKLWKDIHAGTTVKVWRASVQGMKHNVLILDNGAEVQADMVVLATGWKNEHNFFTEHDKRDLGLPFDSNAVDRSQQFCGKWERLEKQADFDVLQRLPLMSMSPDGHEGDVAGNYRLYRSMVPASLSDDDRSVAFAGFLRTTGAPIVYEAQALWVTAYLLGQLKVPNQEEREREVALANRWIRRRYACGRKVPFALFDFMAYVDVLYGDVGVESRRKPNMAAELFGLYKPCNFAGVVDEWMQRSNSGLDRRVG